MNPSSYSFCRDLRERQVLSLYKATLPGSETSPEQCKSQLCWPSQMEHKSPKRYFLSIFTSLPKFYIN